MFRRNGGVFVTLECDIVHSDSSTVKVIGSSDLSSAYFVASNAQAVVVRRLVCTYDNSSTQSSLLAVQSTLDTGTPRRHRPDATFASMCLLLSLVPVIIAIVYHVGNKSLPMN